MKKDIFGFLLAACLSTPFIGVSKSRVPMPRMFAIVYTKNGEIRRTIDPCDEIDDAYLGKAHKVLKNDEVMELFPQHQFNYPIRFPRYVVPHIGTGLIV